MLVLKSKEWPQAFIPERSGYNGSSESLHLFFWAESECRNLACAVKPPLQWVPGYVWEQFGGARPAGGGCPLAWGSLAVGGTVRDTIKHSCSLWKSRLDRSWGSFWGARAQRGQILSTSHHLTGPSRRVLLQWPVEQLQELLLHHPRMKFGDYSSCKLVMSCCFYP